MSEQTKNLYRERSDRHTQLRAELETVRARLARLDGSEDVAVVGALVVRELALARLVPAAYELWQATPDPAVAERAEREVAARQAASSRALRGEVIERIWAIDAALSSTAHHPIPAGVLAPIDANPDWREATRLRAEAQARADADGRGRLTAERAALVEKYGLTEEQIFVGEELIDIPLLRKMAARDAGWCRIPALDRLRKLKQDEPPRFAELPPHVREAVALYEEAMTQFR